MLTWLCSGPECWKGDLFRNRICGWYWRSRPPIRINDISSWSYDIDTMDFMNTVNWNDFEIFFHWHSSCQRVVHVENDFSAKGACHLDNIGVVFWKVQSKARLGIFHPWGVFGVMLHRMPYFSNFIHRDGSSLDGCKYTTECRVAYIHRKPLQIHIYERQTHLQTRFQCQLTKPSRSSMGSAACGRRCFFTSATKLCHQIEFFVNVSKCMIGKEHKRCNFV